MRYYTRYSVRFLIIFGFFLTFSQYLSAVDGSLDTLFDTDGKRTVDFGGGNFASAIALQPDGKSVAVGSTEPSGGDWALVRLNTDGSLDTTFDTDGKVTTNVGGTNENLANDVAIQADGKIVVVGRNSISGATAFFVVARYNANGSLDATFGTGGIVTTNVSGSGDNIANAVAIQTDGKIVVVGEVGSPAEFGVVRYNTDGSLDVTFGTGGIVTTDPGGIGFFNSAQAVLIQTDGKIIVAGTAGVTGPYTAFSIVRYNTDGSLDGLFGSSGITVTKITANQSDTVTGAAFQSDGKIIVVGDTIPAFGQKDFVVVRYTSAGALDDGTFGTAGITTTSVSAFDDVGDVAIQADDKIVLVGGNTDNDNYTILRYTATGSLDSNFGTAGIIYTNISGPDIAKDVVIQDDAKILVVGNSGNAEPNRDFSFVRYLVDTCVGSTQIGSDSTVEVFTDFQVVAPGGRIAALAMIQDGFILCGDGTFSSCFPVAGKICLNNNILTLKKDLIMHNISSISSLGNINGNGYVLDLSKSVSCIPTSDCPEIMLKP